jgi:hypothetical protein
VRNRKRLKDAVADLLRLGLDARVQAKLPKIVTDPVTGLPMITGGHAAVPGIALTPERINQVLLDQETEWFDEAGR